MRQTTGERLSRLSKVVHAMQVEALDQLEASETVQSVIALTAKTETLSEVRVLVEQEIVDHLEDLETQSRFDSVIKEATQ